MSSRRSTRNGFSLLEVAGAIGIMAIIAVLAVSSFRFGSLSNYGAQSGVRVLANVLQEARRRTIATGDNHAVVFFQSAETTSFQIHRRVNGSLTAMGDRFELDRNVAVNLSSTTPPEFNFEGDALRTQSIEISGENRDWTVTVTLAGGGIHVREL